MKKLTKQLLAIIRESLNNIKNSPRLQISLIAEMACILILFDDLLVEFAGILIYLVYNLISNSETVWSKEQLKISMFLFYIVTIFGLVWLDSGS